MARKIVALILGLTVLGLFTTLLFFSKEAGIEVDRVDDGAEPNGALPVRIVATSSVDVRVDGRPVELAELSAEVARIIAAAEEASLPEPAFVIAEPRGSDNMVTIMIMEALSQAGAASVSLDIAAPGEVSYVPPPPIPVMVHDGGELYIAGVEVDMAGLEQEVGAMLARAEEGGLPEPTFAIWAHPEVETGRLLQIMDAIQRGGSTAVSFETHTLED